MLVHITANTAWSDLPLSGVFVAMLRRLVGLSRGVAGEARAMPLSPLQALDGFGRLGPAPAGALAIAGDALGSTVPGPRHPPGYYGTKTERRALNLSAGVADPQRLGFLGGEVTRETYGEAREVDLRRWLLVTAFVLALADLAASLVLRRLIRLAGVTAAAVLMVGAGGAGAQTSDEFVMAASLETRLAYVITDNAEVDEISRAGLRGLSTIVNQRTAAELADPIASSPIATNCRCFRFSTGRSRPRWKHRHRPPGRTSTASCATAAPSSSTPVIGTAAPAWVCSGTWRGPSTSRAWCPSRRTMS